MLLASAMLPGPCAATTFKDVKVAVRVLDFASVRASASPMLAVFYDSQNRESVKDARAIQGWIGQSAMPGEPEMASRLIDLRGLADAPPVSAAVLAKGGRPFYDAIAAYARRNGTLTIAADMDCVRDDKCVVGISSDPRVEVVISQGAALASGVQFSEAFRMMVTVR